MTEIQLKKLLRQLYAAQIQDSLLEECSKITKTNQANIQYSENIQFKILGETLNILSWSERFVIETHLVYHHTWSETTELYAKEIGREYEKSERTLKRIQSRALKKIADFINDSPLKTYFYET